MDDVIKILIIIVVFVGSFPRHGSNLQSVFKHNERLSFDENITIHKCAETRINQCLYSKFLLIIGPTK